MKDGVRVAIGGEAQVAKEMLSDSPMVLFTLTMASMIPRIG
jgi:hypothetical protein